MRATLKAVVEKNEVRFIEKREEKSVITILLQKNNTLL